MTSPREKKLQLVPFVIHATRGLLRDTRARRKTMAAVLLAIVAMLTLGMTALRPWLEHHEHPWRFLFYYFACAWLTMLVLLLAVLDLLLIRTQGRALRRAIREDFSKKIRQPDNSPNE